MIHNNKIILDVKNVDVKNVDVKNVDVKYVDVKNVDCFDLSTTAAVVAGPMDSSLRRHSTSSWAQSKPISSHIRFSVCRGFPRLSRAFCE